MLTFLPPDAQYQILYLQAAPLLPGQPIYVAYDWAHRRHALERDAAANGVRLLSLDPFDVGVRTVQSRSSSRYVLLLRAALCRHKCCHQKLTLLPPDAHFPILYLQAAALLPGQPIYVASDWARRRHTPERDAAANGVRLISLDPFDVGVRTVQSRSSSRYVLLLECYGDQAPNTVSSTTQSPSTSVSCRDRA